jgi:hypothetical protein
MTVAALVLAASLPRFVADVGRIDPPFDVPIRAEVEVRNASGAAVELERGIPHCAGCTRVTGVPVTVPAGGTARIGIVFEPGDSRGRLRFGCTLLSGGVPWAVADAEATACGIDLRGPGTVEFGAVESGSASERSFRVRTVGPPGARLQAAAGGSAHAAVAADGAPTALADGTLVRHWLVTARIGCAPGADEVRERIDLRLAAGERTIESRPVVVRAEPWQPSSAAPGALFLGCVDGLDACERHVLLPRGAGALSAEGAEAAAAGPGPGPGPGRERVALRIPAPARNDRPSPRPRALVGPVDRVPGCRCRRRRAPASLRTRRRGGVRVQAGRDPRVHHRLPRPDERRPGAASRRGCVAGGRGTARGPARAPRARREHAGDRRRPRRARRPVGRRRGD